VALIAQRALRRLAGFAAQAAAEDGFQEREA